MGIKVKSTERVIPRYGTHISVINSQIVINGYGFWYTEYVDTSIKGYRTEYKKRCQEHFRGTLKMVGKAINLL